MADDLQAILGDAYATDSAGGQVKPGVFCIAAIPYVMDNYYVLRPLNPDPASADHRRYKLEHKNPVTLATGGQNSIQFPFKDLNLDVDEDLVLVKMKRRPVLVLSRAIEDETKADSNRFPSSFWCIPCYTMVDQLGYQQWLPNVIEDVLALSYRSCFPLPYVPRLHERICALRLDRMEPIRKENLRPLDFRLSKEWLLYVQEWARFYITGELGDADSQANPKSIAMTLKDARDVFMAVLAENRAKASDPAAGAKP